MKSFFKILLLGLGLSSFAQEYQFTPVIDINCSTVKSQGNTGTCWSFSTTSFLESEVKRLSGKDIDLSEMYTVRNTYPQKAWNYVMRQGKAQFSEGGLAHDVLNAVAQSGLVPEATYNGLDKNVSRHDHSEMVAIIKSMLDAYIQNPGGFLSPKWKQAVSSMLDLYLGKNLTTFTYEGKEYTPKTFLKMTKVNPKEYVTITSFSHQPFYKNFVLNIPDNFSNGSMYNVPLDTFEKIIINALEQGYTVELDTDVSETAFSSKHGVAVIPAQKNEAASLISVKPEKEINQVYRQQEFENFNTTDDHLMHITGLSKDQNGTLYFKTKNSWGNQSDRVNYGGYVYMSASYIRLKAISVTVHKDALKQSLKKQLNL